MAQPNTSRPASAAVASFSAESNSHVRAENDIATRKGSKPTDAQLESYFGETPLNQALTSRGFTTSGKGMRRDYLRSGRVVARAVHVADGFAWLYRRDRKLAALSAGRAT